VCDFATGAASGMTMKMKEAVCPSHKTAQARSMWCREISACELRGFQRERYCWSSEDSCIGGIETVPHLHAAIASSVAFQFAASSNIKSATRSG
jgi:hypothetical protein